MILLGIDPAISCGWCVSKIENDTLTLIDCGFIEVMKCEYSGDTCLDLQKQIRELFAIVQQQKEARFYRLP